MERIGEYLILTSSMFESTKEKELKRELEFVKLNEELHAKKITQLDKILTRNQKK